ncbi:MAG: phospholipase A2 [Sciscionella sp.]
MSYVQFIRYKSSGARYPGLDYSSDGCSSTPAGLKQIFDSACQLHDFGYRNFGSGLRLGRNDSTRLWVDNRFHDEMNRICQDTHKGFAEQGNLTVCRYQAQVVYDKVRQFGANAFYGGGSAS